MNKKLTITIDEAVYEGLQHTIGRAHISRFLENLARPFVLREDMEAAYREMATDKEREAEALEWSEGMIGDTDDDAR